MAVEGLDKPVRVSSFDCHPLIRVSSCTPVAGQIPGPRPERVSGGTSMGALVLTVRMELVDFLPNIVYDIYSADRYLNC